MENSTFVHKISNKIKFCIIFETVIIYLAIYIPFPFSRESKLYYTLVCLCENLLVSTLTKYLVPSFFFFSLNPQFTDMKCIRKAHDLQIIQNYTEKTENFNVKTYNNESIAEHVMFSINIWLKNRQKKFNLVLCFH
jgi:hypothetical protein